MISFQRNRYSVPCEWVNPVVSLRAYHDRLVVIGPEGRSVSLIRCFERDQTIYDWMHYIGLIQMKPGALRNGAAFRTMPQPLQELQRQLLKHPGGDRIMAQALSVVPLHGIEPVLIAVELAPEAGRVSGEHVVNLLARMKEQRPQIPSVETGIILQEPAKADVDRYDALRDREVGNVQ